MGSEHQSKEALENTRAILSTVHDILSNLSSANDTIFEKSGRLGEGIELLDSQMDHEVDQMNFVSEDLSNVGSQFQLQTIKEFIRALNLAGADFSDMSDTIRNYIEANQQRVSIPGLQPMLDSIDELSKTLSDLEKITDLNDEYFDKMERESDKLETTLAEVIAFCDDEMSKYRQ